MSASFQTLPVFAGALRGDLTIQSGAITWNITNVGSQPANGRYVTGDPWVVGPVTVSSVSPAWDGTTNGSMVDPDPAGTTQGYDNRAGMSFTFAGGVRQTFPFTLRPGQSLISTVGKAVPTTDGGATHVSDASVLTCVSASQSATAFRPPYVSGTKAAWTTGDVNYGLLLGLAVPSGTSAIDMSSSGNYANRVLLHHGAVNVFHSQIMPENHTDAIGGYPYEVALELGRMALACHCNIAAAQSIANRLIQFGIDMYACANSNGETWSWNGGFGVGKKWPIVFAGLMLNSTPMKNPPLFVTGSSGLLKFQEDANTYYGNPSGTTPRWGEDCTLTPGSYSDSNHSCRPSAGDVDQWELADLGGVEGATAGAYEVCCNPRAFIGPALACRLMSQMALWNHTEFFDYTDRFVNTVAAAMAADGQFGLANDFQIDVNKYGGDGAFFMKRMWETYR